MESHKRMQKINDNLENKLLNVVSKQIQLNFDGSRLQELSKKVQGNGCFSQ